MRKRKFALKNATVEVNDVLDEMMNEPKGDRAMMGCVMIEVDM